MAQKIYDETFYNSQLDGSYRSARVYAHHLLGIFTPDSVADLGCGRGTWLKAFGECGTKKLVGFDGDWNSQAQMVDQTITYVPTDLNKPLAASAGRYDLAISMEVAEHLKPESAQTFVQNITSLSDVVMFSAAYENQGGTDHLNEQPHSHWAKLFMAQGYVPYDVFRPTIWGNKDVEFWYQQNAFLYVKNTSPLNKVLEQAGYRPIKNIEFMNCVHPSLLKGWIANGDKLSTKILVGKLFLKLFPKKLRPAIVALKKRAFG